MKAFVALTPTQVTHTNFMEVSGPAIVSTSLSTDHALYPRNHTSDSETVFTAVSESEESCEDVSCSEVRQVRLPESSFSGPLTPSAVLGCVTEQSCENGHFHSCDAVTDQSFSNECSVDEIPFDDSVTSPEKDGSRRLSQVHPHLLSLYSRCIQCHDTNPISTDGTSLMSCTAPTMPMNTTEKSKRGDTLIKK